MGPTARLRLSLERRKLHLPLPFAPHHRQHLSMSRQVQLVVSFNVSPQLTGKVCNPISRNFFLPMPSEDVVLPRIIVKLPRERLHLLLPLFLAVHVVGKGLALDVEEVRQLGIREVRGFANILPYLLDVFHHVFLQPLHRRTVVTVPEDEEQQRLRNVLLHVPAGEHQPQVSLNDSLDQRKIRSVKTPHFMHPHINHHDICQSKGEQRALALERLLVLLLPPVRPLHVHHQDLPALGARTPDPLCRLLPPAFRVHHLEARPEQLVQKGRLPAALPPDDRHDVIGSRLLPELVAAHKVRKLLVELHVVRDDLTAVRRPSHLVNSGCAALLTSKRARQRRAP
mmetsp:Transcript_35964/g.112471  ORF Transcript_35964/g.112471 Transcript_35964/m.112471 type:complete len:340 (-) Transcript_35964:10-1029(-)